MEDPNATPIFPNVQSKKDTPIDTAYAPQYSDVVAATDAELEQSRHPPPPTGQPMYSPHMPEAQSPAQPAPRQDWGAQQQAPVRQQPQFEYEKRPDLYRDNVGYNAPAATAMQPPLHYYSSGESDIPLYIKYRLPIIAAIVFLLVLVYAQPKLATALPSAFPAGRPNTVGLAAMASLAAAGFYVGDRVTKTM